MDKYINSDLEQAKLLQSIAFNNTLASIEQNKPSVFYTDISINLDVIQETLIYRYNTYRKNIDKVSINYEFKIKDFMYLLKVSLTNGHITTILKV